MMTTIEPVQFVRMPSNCLCRHRQPGFDARGRRTFIARDEIAQLGGTGVRIDRDRFRADLDRVADQDL